VYVAVETDRNVVALHKSLIEWMCLDSPAGGSRGLWDQLFSYRAQIFLCCPIFFFLWPFYPIPGHGHPLRGFAFILRHATLGRNPLEDESARCKDLCLTTQNTHKRQTFIYPVGFEPESPASEQPQTYALDRTVTGTDLDDGTYCK